MQNLIGGIRSHLLIAALVLVGLFVAVRFLVTHKAGSSSSSSSSSGGAASGPFFTPGQAIVVQVPTSATAPGSAGGTTGSVGTGTTPAPRPAPAGAPPAPAPVQMSAPSPVVRQPLAVSPIHTASAAVGRAIVQPAPRVIHVPTGVTRAQQVTQSRGPVAPVKRFPLPGVLRAQQVAQSRATPAPRPVPARTPTGVRRFLNIA